CARGTGSFAYW
nr:immunoglobulin heavy chain junction region [Mus musculus]